MSAEGRPRGRELLVGTGRDHTVVTVLLGDDGAELGREVLSRDRWIERARGLDPSVRLVWSDTRAWYPELIAQGVGVVRCHDLRLCRAILRGALGESPASPWATPDAWDEPAETAARPAPSLVPTLFDADEPVRGAPLDIDAVVAERSRQRTALGAAPSPASLRVLLAAESAGALIADELHIAGLPWSEEEHRRILDRALGVRGLDGGPPENMRRAADAVRAALGDPTLSLDSQPKVLRALHRAGILVESTSRWELERHSHPAISPLLEYKRLSRLMTANGWTWLGEWVQGGRFRPVYVPGGVVTGRWASSGGGALQIPRMLRQAVRADPGWVLVVADVAQLEPRVLAAMAGDLAMADAARGTDLYAGIVDRGAVATRNEAKLAMLGAMYGATSGESGRLVPRLRRIFPRAMALVDDAARTGEEGGVVTTRLGRTSPPPDDAWRALQARASDPDATSADEDRARRAARDRGRFTRNFVVQGTAAEWALCWLGELRHRLGIHHAAGSGSHLAFFLHDEIIVHAPAADAERAADAVRDAADAATRLIFGDFPLDFPLDLRIAQSADKA